MSNYQIRSGTSFEGDGVVLRVADRRDTKGALSTHSLDSGIVTLSTSGASTTIDANLPAGALVTGVSVEITTAIAGADATTVTFALTGGSSSTLTTVSALAAGTKGSAALAIGPLTATTDITVTLSGGSDQTPSAGAVRIVVHYSTVAAL